jgi:alkylation response protein AidB-like acyl-CoA dehydrogenase
LASVRTRATRNNHGWLLNGRKVWTTNAHRSHYMIALVRTSGTPEDRHKGLSQVLIDLSLPGVVVRPIQDISGDAHFCEVLFEDVQLTEHALVGNEGDGWKQVTAELAFERSGPERIYSSIVLAQTWLDEFRASGSLHPTAVAIAGRMAGRLAVLRSMSLAVAAKLDKGEAPRSRGRAGQGPRHRVRTTRARLDWRGPRCRRHAAVRRAHAHAGLRDAALSVLLAAGRHA